jgi:hypothetical protein
MTYFILFAFVLSICLNVASSVAIAARQCKEVPSSPGWPDPNTWAALNATLSGRLLAALPPAIVCDQSRDQYSPDQCSVVNQDWWTAAFHVDDPVSVQWPNWQQDACLPSIAYNGSNPCSVDVFAKYTVNASTAEHVVQALKFANKHNLRGSVKNTGHDWIGRLVFLSFKRGKAKP